MSEHTPGPWHLDVLAHTITDTGNYDNRWIVRGNNHERIADMFEEGDEADANANLIAAAPEMLEALKVFMDYNDQGGPLSFNTDAMWAQARAAIAKAEGREMP